MERAQTWLVRLFPAIFLFFSGCNPLGDTPTAASRFMAPAPIPVPGSFTITSVAAGNGEVTLSWTAASGAVSYTVSYGTTAGSYTTTASTQATSPYTVTGLSNDSSYYFMVTAVNTYGSTNATGGGTGSAPPGAMAVTAAIPADGAAYLFWGASSGSTSFSLAYGTTSGNYPNTVTTDAASPYIVTGLTNGTTYYFSVTAWDGSGGSNTAAEVAVTPGAWTKQMGVTSASTEAQAVATDASGNTLVAGYTSGALDGNTRTGIQDLFLTKYDRSGAKYFTQQLGVNNKLTQALGVTADSSGNIYVAGYTTGALDGQTFTGNDDAFVTQYDATGAKKFTRLIGVSSKSVYANQVVTDPSGNVYLAGDTSGALPGNTQMGTKDFFIAKYDSSGNPGFIAQLGVTGTNTVANGIASDSSGNLYVTGTTTGGLDGNTLTGTQDVFLTKYDSSGNRLFTKQLGVASHSTTANAVATDPFGYVYISGFTNGGLDGNTLTGTNDFFVTKYDSSGTKIITHQLGVASKDTYSFGVSTDANGNLYVGGYTTGGLDGNTLTADQGLFLTKYNEVGQKLFTKELGPASSAKVWGTGGIATDPFGFIYIAGYTNGNMDGNTLTGTQDFVVVKYDGSGDKN